MWCSVRVDRALKGVAGVEASELDFNSGRLSVEYDAADTSPDAMIAALLEAGYGASLEP